MMTVTPVRDASLLFGYCCLIFFMSHQSTLPVAMMFPHQDKLIHASAYALMGGLAWLSFRHFNFPVKITACIALLFASVYGVTDEYHQSFIAGRDADMWDWVAGTTGALLMIAIIVWRKRQSC